MVDESVGAGLGVVVGAGLCVSVGAGLGESDGAGLGDSDGAGLGDADGAGLGVSKGVGVGDGEAVGAGVEDLPDVQVTELPSAERTHTICDPVLDAVGCGVGLGDDPVVGRGDALVVAVGDGAIVVRWIVTGCDPARGGTTTRTDFTVVCRGVAGAVTGVVTPGEVAAGAGVDVAAVDVAVPADAGAAVPAGAANAATEPPMGVMATASETTSVSTGCAARHRGVDGRDESPFDGDNHATMTGFPDGDQKDRELERGAD